MITRERANEAIAKQQRYNGHGVIGISYPPGVDPSSEGDASLMLALPTRPFISYVPLAAVDPSKFTDPPFTLAQFCDAAARLRAEDALAAQSQ